MTEKKVTKLSSKTSSKAKTTSWEPSKANKDKSFQLRLLAAGAWLVAIIAQLASIWYMIHTAATSDFKLWLVIVGIVVDLIFAILGGQLWKRSNHLNPPSEKNKFLFFLQSQLGLFVAIIAFLPIIIFIFTSDKLDKKQKGILGSIAVVALLAAGITSVDFHPASKEAYARQAAIVTALTGQDYAYAGKGSEKYHLDKDCRYLKNSTEVFEGTVEDLHAHSSKVGTSQDDLCSACAIKALKAKGLDANQSNYKTLLADFLDKEINSSDSSSN